MTCIYYVPQVLTSLGSWIDADKPQATFELADSQRLKWSGNTRTKGFRVQQVSCNKPDKNYKPCCGR